MCVGSRYMGIAQIDLDPPLTNRQTWKKMLQSILASLYTPRQTWEKSVPKHPGKPLHPTFWAMPMATTHFKEGASLMLMSDITM